MNSNTSDEIKDQVPKIISMEIPNTNTTTIEVKMRSFKFGFIFGALQSTKFLNNLASFSKKYKLMKDLRLSLESFKSSQKMRYMDIIKDLKPKHDKNIGLMIFGLKILRKLDYSWIDSNKSTSKYILYKISRLKSLKNLSIKIYHNANFKILQNSKMYKHSIQSLSNVEHMEFKLNTPSTFFESLWNGIVFSKKLKSLILDLSYGNNLGENILQCMHKRIRNLNFLQTFRFKWKNAWRFTNFGLEIISNVLLRVSQIKTLELDFEDNFQINDEGVFHLQKAVQSLKSLENLSINLSCEFITNEGAGNLTEEILKLLSLRSLFLSLRSRKYRNDEFFTLIQSFSNTKLGYFYLNLSDCVEITKNSILVIKKKMQNIPCTIIEMKRTSVSSEDVNEISKLSNITILL